MIPKNKFYRYHLYINLIDVREPFIYNMLTAQKITGLTRDEIMEIRANYHYLQSIYLTGNSVKDTIGNLSTLIQNIPI